jgi:hypothetical protein
MAPTTLFDTAAIDDKTLGPLTSAQRSMIMSHAVSLSPEARSLYRRLLILGQHRGLEQESIARAAGQARAHFER